MLIPEPRGSGAFPRTALEELPPVAARVWRGKAAVLAPSPRAVQLRPRWGPALPPHPAPPRRLSAGRADPTLGRDRHGEGAQRVTSVQTCAFAAHPASRPRGLAVPGGKQGLRRLAAWRRPPAPARCRRPPVPAQEPGTQHQPPASSGLFRAAAKRVSSLQETALGRGTFLSSVAGREPRSRKQSWARSG